MNENRFYEFNMHGFPKIDNYIEVGISYPIIIVNIYWSKRDK